MQRKIFIAISLSPLVKKRLMQKIEKWADLPVKWLCADNLHITLAFLGHVDNEKLVEICATIRHTARKLDIFEIALTGITLGPGENKPRMVWATGEKSEMLKIIQEEIEKSLKIFIREKRGFRPHVTLGRIRQEKWKEISPPPEIKEKINFIIPVDTIDILESVFDEGKRKYLVVESCVLS